MTIETMIEIEGVAEVLDLAEDCAARSGEMYSSAGVCLSDAMALFNRGEYGRAYGRALRSIAHSRGVFSAEYKRAQALATRTGMGG